MVASSRWVQSGTAVAMLALAAFTVACEELTNPGGERRVIGVAEVTFRHVHTTHISASAAIALAFSDLDQLPSGSSSGGLLDIISLDAVSTSVFTHTLPGGERTRFLRATFGVRNTRPEQRAFDPLRENVSFVAVRTAKALAKTPVHAFERRDGLAASETLARQLVPTGIAAVDADGELVTVSSEGLRALSPGELENTVLPDDVLEVFTYAFVVKRAPTGVPPRFEGAVTFSYRLPDDPDVAKRPATISVLFLIVDDTHGGPTQ